LRVWVTPRQAKALPELHHPVPSCSKALVPSKKGKELTKSIGLLLQFSGHKQEKAVTSAWLK